MHRTITPRPHAHCARAIAYAATLALLSGCRSSGGPTASIPLERDTARIERAELPPAALNALIRLAGDQPLTALRLEDRGNRYVYRAHWLRDGLEHDASVLADGTLIEEAEEVVDAEFASLPEAVQARVRLLEQQGNVVGLARRTFIVYELQYNPAEGGRTADVLIRPDGSDAARSP